MSKRPQHVADCKGDSRSWRSSSRRSRHGFASMEVLVSAVILCATVTAVTSLLFKCGMIWRDVSQHRVAVHELSAQLEELTLMDADSVAEKIKLLKPSPICAERLPESKIEGALVEDNLGVRVTLSINWKRTVESKSIVLCGWLIEPEDSE